MAKTIKINDKLWNEASSEDKDLAIDFLLVAGLIESDDTFQPDSATADFEESELHSRIAGDVNKLLTTPCRIVCIAAYEAAMRSRSCRRNPICKIAAKAALAACLAACPG